jgi:hypothetical protein
LKAFFFYWLSALGANQAQNERKADVIGEFIRGHYYTRSPIKTHIRYNMMDGLGPAAFSLSTLNINVLIFSFGSFLSHVGMCFAAAIFSLVYESAGLIDSIFSTPLKDFIDSKVPVLDKESLESDLFVLTLKKKQLLTNARKELTTFREFTLPENFDFDYNIKKDALYVSLLKRESRKLYYDVLFLLEHQKEKEKLARQKMYEAEGGYSAYELDPTDNIYLYFNDIISRILNCDLWHSFSDVIEKEIKILYILAGFITVPAQSLLELIEKIDTLSQEFTLSSSVALFFTLYFGYLCISFVANTALDILSFFMEAPSHIYRHLMHSGASATPVNHLYQDDNAISLAAPKIQLDERLPIFNVL